MLLLTLALLINQAIAYFFHLHTYSLENKQWIHLHLNTVYLLLHSLTFLEVLLHLTGRIFWHKNHYKWAQWLSTIAINDIWRRIRFRWRISLFFQLKIKQVAQQLDTNSKVLSVCLFVGHSSEIRGLCLMKWSGNTLQNMPFFIYMYMKT